MVLLSPAGPVTQDNTGAVTKSNVTGTGQDNKGDAETTWKAAIRPATAEASAPSGQTLPPDVYLSTRVAWAGTMPARFLPKDQPSGTDSGSPENAKNGAEAAKALLSKDNPYFYNPILFRTDRSYNPDEAKAQAFAATLFDYEQKGDNANIAQMLQTLGPDEAAKLLARAGTLQGQQVNGNGTAFDQNPVLAKALLAPGVQLGDGTKQGTLAYSLLQQAGQSGSDASSIAGILNASGTSPQTEALKQKFLDGILTSGRALGKPSFEQAGFANAARTLINGDPALLSKYPGGIGVQQVFASSDGVPDTDKRFLTNLERGVDADLYKDGKPGKDPITGSISNSTNYDIQQYLAGKLTQGETSAQLLGNMMSVFGPGRTYAVLSQMKFDQSSPIKYQDIQSSLKTLTESGQFTADDAKALALAQAKFGDSASGQYGGFDVRNLGTVGSLFSSLPDTPNGTAVKAAYAEGCNSGIQQLTQDIASGKYSGQQLSQITATLNSLADNEANVSAKLPVAVKAQLFSDLHATATQFAKRGDGKEADALNAYAAGLLSSGSPDGQAQIAAALRAMGGVGANGYIDPNSGLGQFLQSALRGQASFGFGVSDLTPNMDMPNGVTHLLNGIAASGDTKLMAGTLDAVMQWTMQNPTQAEALAAQDTKDGTPGYREALTSLLDKSFNDFVALDPADTNAKLVRSMQPQTLADLQALSAIEMGPPYDSKAAGDFAGVIGKHAIEFAAYAEGKAKDPVLDNLFAGIGDKADATQRNASAIIFGQIMNGFGAGLNQSEASARALAHDAKSAADQALLEARIVTDFLRGAGTGLLLASTGFTGPMVGAGAGEKLISVIGRVGLFTGSLGTLGLDAFFSNMDAKSEQQAIQAVEQGMKTADLKPKEAMQQLYNGWFSTLSQQHDLGDENQEVLAGVMNGSSFATAAMVETEVQDFYNAYDPMGYYRNLTGQNPPVA